jgi:hypothetical protein
MRKTLVYIAILAMLAAGIYYMLPGDDSNNPFDPKEADFSVKDTGAIGRIFLSSMNEESALLERTDSGWMVNKQYKVLPSALNLLMETLLKQRVLYPVTKAAYENSVKTLATHGIKVELYDRAGKKMKIFYVGGASAGEKGTDMLMDGATQPYVVEAPGFVGYLTPRYPTRLRDWRDRIVFDVLPHEVKRVSVQYPGKPDESFVLERDANDTVIVTTTDKTLQNKPLNSRRAHLYLRFFAKVNCEGYLNGLPDNDSALRTAPPHSTIELTTTRGDVHMAEVYWMPVNKRSKNVKETEKVDDHDIPDEYDADRLYAVVNNRKDTIMIQHLTFQGLFRKAKEFYAPDVAPGSTPNK